MLELELDCVGNAVVCSRLVAAHGGTITVLDFWADRTCLDRDFRPDESDGEDLSQSDIDSDYEAELRAEMEIEQASEDDWESADSEQESEEND